jgi:hypothetical protein
MSVVDSQERCDQVIWKTNDFFVSGIGAELVELMELVPLEST